MTAPQQNQNDSNQLPMGTPNGAQRTSLNIIEDGTIVLVEMTVGFNRISSHIEGDELARYNQGRKYPRNRPYTTVSGTNPRVIQNPQNQSDNQQLAERAVSERFYQSNQDNQWSASYDNKTQNLPGLWEADGQGGYNQVNPIPGDLDNGQRVYVQLRFYETAGNNGISLENIYLPDGNATYYQGGSTANLSDYGITLNAAPQPSQGTAQPAPQSNQGQQDYSLPQPNQGQQAQGQAQAQPQQANYNQGYDQQQQYAQPNQPQQNQPQQPQGYAQPQQNQGYNQGYNQQQQASPWDNPQQQNQGGIWPEG
jgi:hypothetical protein